MSDVTLDPGSSLWQDAAHRLARNRAAMVSVVALFLIIAVCLILPAIPGLIQDPDLQNLPDKNLGPSAAHWFGTDHLGRDILSRVLSGGRISIAVGLITTLVSVTIGVCWGALSGYAGGKTDALMMRIVDILYALPFLIVVILLGKTLEPLTTELTTLVVGWLNPAGSDSAAINKTTAWVEPITTLVPLFIAIGTLSWLTVSRIVRAQVQSVAKQDFVEAARSLGPWSFPHPVPPHPAEHARPHHRLHHAHHPRRHAVGSHTLLPRPRCETALQLLGHPHRRGREPHALQSLAALFPHPLLRHHPLLPELPR